MTGRRDEGGRRATAVFRKASVAAVAALAALTLTAGPAGAKPGKDAKDDEKAGDPLAERWGGLELRGLGPATAGGRISEVAVQPGDDRTWLVAVSSGGVWRTDNAGTTWTPVFDGEGSFSIGTVVFAPSDPMIAWVGTGENNAQRSVAYGDGVYKSIDGGRSWKKMGLERSEHVGRILIDPRDPDVVWVAAQGPLWKEGGDRGLYKTTDGGATWKRVLEISEHTGVSDIAFDPRDADTVYATSWQRRRHVWTFVAGGPESAIWKTTDGGASFRKIVKGLPDVDLGRIGLAVSPIEPDVVYAIVEAARGESGFYRSENRGESWEKRGGHATSGNYYIELVADPHRFDRVYSMDVFLKVTDDGGKTFHDLGESSKHVDNHSIWIDPDDDEHYLVGCDGGLYETFDAARTWNFKANLPTVQFYKVSVDDSTPFYRVYGGTQDNFTFGVPSRTISQHGILNSDWTVVTTGDGFQARSEPGDPDIVYAQAQYGSLVRTDRRTGEETYIAPMPEPGEPPLRWNWDSPLVVSPHAPQRLYFAAQRVYRSDDRGTTWRPVSGDLSRQLDRDRIPVMGRIQPADAVAKHASTSPWGSVVAFAESRRVEGLLYAGTDDGVVQVSEDGGASWRRIDRFPGVPELVHVRRVEPSRHAADVVYAAFDDHKQGNFRPYVLKSADRGRTWTSIAGDLPERGTVYALLEDPVDPQLLYAGTEFGLWVTQDGGRDWFRLSGGLPTIQVRDLAFQEREDDLVLATFGRGFYVLEDVSPLRFADRRDFSAEAILFPVRAAHGFVAAQPLGYRDKAFQGDALYAAPNPPAGAVFTLHLKDDLLSARKARWEREAELEKQKKDAPYPTPAQLSAEALEEEPALFLVVRDAAGEIVRRLDAPTDKGLHRVAWDLRWPPPDPARLDDPKPVNAYTPIPLGPMAAPGRYSVTLEKRIAGRTTPLAGPEAFEVRPVFSTVLTAADRGALERFLRDASAPQRATLGASRVADETLDRLELVARALDDSLAPDTALADEARRIERELHAVQHALDGDPELDRRSIPRPPSLTERTTYIVYAQWNSTSEPTATSRRSYELASAELGRLLASLRPLVERDLPALERRLDAVGAPWTPGRVPAWPPATAP
jgi:photosystem II stability/assembly factor-like uncharacterized protein